MGGVCWLECGGKHLVGSCVDASSVSERKALLSAVGGGRERWGPGGGAARGAVSCHGAVGGDEGQRALRTRTAQAPVRPGFAGSENTSRGSEGRCLL